ncbi:hypothetical protein Taro_007928, partial [Colocasia esculenta]|nr:hypothetical protein [Colocasia esculenta]
NPFPVSPVDSILLLTPQSSRDTGHSLSPPSCLPTSRVCSGLRLSPSITADDSTGDVSDRRSLLPSGPLFYTLLLMQWQRRFLCLKVKARELEKDLHGSVADTLTPDRRLRTFMQKISGEWILL